MEKRTPILAALLTLLSLGAGRAEGATAAPPVGPIAVIADRRVEEADIRRAAQVMKSDPLRKRRHAAWRKKLLDLCVDRELLALEAERQGFLNDPAVTRRIERESAGALHDAIRDAVLLPEIRPTAAQIDTARAGGLFRRVKATSIKSLTDTKTTNDIAAAMKNGASFDSIAALYSIDPMSIKGGDVGWRRIRDLNAAAWRDAKGAKPGDVLGPYSDAPAHDFYKIVAVQDPSDADLRDALTFDRSRGIESRYDVGVFTKYHFKIDPNMVSAMIFAAATEQADSILASLDERGTRGKRGVRPSLGVLARVDGDSLTYRDIAHPEIMGRDPDGKARIEDTRRLLSFCMAAVLPRLVARDARERGIDRDPAVARSLRLIREEVSTREMVGRAVPAPDSSATRAYFDTHPSRYLRPAARRALVAMFASEDSARTSLWAWSGPGFRDSTLAGYGLRAQERATAASLLSGCYAEMPLFDTDGDPLSAAVRALDEGQVSPVIRTPHGYALARVLGREPARPMTFEEASSRLAVEVREDLENLWVERQLERLRAATPARTVPERLEAIRLGTGPDTGGKRR